MSFVRMIASARKQARKVGLAPELGHTWLYHGTSKANVQKIRKEGVKASASEGISSLAGLTEANEGLTFFTTKKGTAKNYARQQEYLEKSSSMGGMPSAADVKAWRVNPFATETGEVMRFSVPRSVIKKQGIVNPEIEILKNKAMMDANEKRVALKALEEDKIFPEALGSSFQIEKVSSVSSRLQQTSVNNLAVGSGALYLSGSGETKLSKNNQKKVERASKRMFKSTYHGEN